MFGSFATATRNAGGSTGKQMAELFAVMTRAMSSEGPPEARRAAIGQFALAADALPEDQFVASFRYLKGETWPARFACTAVVTASTNPRSLFGAK